MYMVRIFMKCTHVCAAKSLLTLYQIISNMNHIDSRQLKWTAQVNVLLSNYKQNIKSLSLFVGTTVQMGVGSVPVFLRNLRPCKENGPQSLVGRL